MKTAREILHEVGSKHEGFGLLTGTIPVIAEAMEAYHKQFSQTGLAGVWVKASEKRPPRSERVNLKVSGIPNAGKYVNDEYTMPEFIMIDSSTSYFKEDFNKIEWLDESQPIPQSNFGEWQSCPHCNGSGQQLADGFISTIYTVCSVCKGAKTIQRPPIPVNQDDYWKKRCDACEMVLKTYSDWMDSEHNEIGQAYEKWQTALDVWQQLKSNPEPITFEDAAKVIMEEVVRYSYKNTTQELSKNIPQHSR